MADSKMPESQSHDQHQDHRDDKKHGQVQHEPLTEDEFRQHMHRAAVLLSHGKGREAIPLLERCFRLRPEDENVLINLGGAYILAEKHKQAVPYLEKAVEIDPDNPAVWSNLAAAYLGKLVTASRNRQNRALAAYARVIELDAGYPNVHYNMGLIYIDQRDWDAAHTAFSRAIETNPHDKDAHAMLNRLNEIRSRPPDVRMN
ncbi:MAG: tetratricopeptide repeat protein [Anaerolineae bacterium]|nr:tetratricopeptide repeat protein [Anaerolineae bacterium]